MSIELKVPSMGESVVEVELGEWLKKEGESVARDEAVVVLESDKVTLELPAPAAGRVTKILKQAGEIAEVGEVIGHMEQGEAVAATAPSEKSAAVAEEVPAPAPLPTAAAAENARVMPAARRLMAEKGLSQAEVQPSGPGGRILKEDVQRASAAPVPPPAAPIPTGAPSAARQEDVVPMSRLRRRIAERLVESQQIAALLTTFNEIDMTAVKELRSRYKDDFAAKYGSKLGFMSFFVKAAIDALKLVPTVNAEIRGEQIAYKNFYDIGVAVGGGRGLVVPVLRDADRMSFAQVELKIADFASRARDNALTLDDLQGGTFTISNGGVYGSMMSTPIVNPPQTGILGLHAIKDRPVALDGEVVIRPMMYVALTYDHRLIDGRESVTFLKRIKEAIEEPSRILLEI